MIGEVEAEADLLMVEWNQSGFIRKGAAPGAHLVTALDGRRAGRDTQRQHTWIGQRCLSDQLRHPITRGRGG